jgi:hypothetical protein
VNAECRRRCEIEGGRQRQDERQRQEMASTGTVIGDAPNPVTPNTV